ncbi:hypothetical protein E4J89_09875 [Arthrobacter sp. CAU 1506]|uniref:hypothetical protein n=1 Tax=Arthrobacter sp. CAU 1506 TaxID=2560052 RepID=UPI0010AC67FB|nr:hypothetical protein [Arthrobacter sp. CAU 1506]TJY69594.1 hypothetical protein E4J89_09875 [Arthrobacter sp. CAU 1506]
MRRPGLSTLAVCLALAAAPALPAADAAAAKPFSFAVIGDVPYGSTQLAKFPGRIAQINADPRVKLVAHLGDISSPINCSNSYYAKVKSAFNRFADPLIYTPGDNEWADCHRADVGAGSPLKRLAAVRRVFFPKPGRTLGKTTAAVTPQSKYPENVRLKRAGIIFGALHAVGSKNDLSAWTGLGYSSPTAAQRSEVTARTKAGISLIRSTFAQAKASKARAVVLLTQADMFVGSGSTYKAAYRPLVRAIAAESTRFGRPVFLFNGDTHAYRSDRPLTSSKWLSFYGIAKKVPNLRRVSIQGGTSFKEWLRVTVVNKASVLKIERVRFR